MLRDVRQPFPNKKLNISHSNTDIREKVISEGFLRVSEKQ